MDIYAPDDAVATGARYLQASGAPGDWRRAVFAYNHADAYVDRVFQQAAAYREAASESSPPGAAPPTSLVAGDGAWLAESRGCRASAATSASSPTS